MPLHSNYLVLADLDLDLLNSERTLHHDLGAFYCLQQGFNIQETSALYA